MIKVTASGYFNLLRKGQVKYLQKVKALGGYLVVIINNNTKKTWRLLKSYASYRTPHS